MRVGVKLLAVFKQMVIYSLIIGSGNGAVFARKNAPHSARRSVASANAPPIPPAGPPMFTDLAGSPAGNSTQKITEDDPNAPVYAILIDAFEKLGIVTPQKKTCYTVKKIIREVFSEDPRRPRRTLGVYLYIEESILNDEPDSRNGNLDTASDVKNSKLKEHAQGGTNSTDGGKIYHSNSSGDAECRSSPIIVITGGDIMAQNNGTALSDGNTAVNTSGGMISAQTVDDHAGLSRTQVMVISTCSAVIGTFFLVAAIMRVRNYVKRTREEREVAQRPQFRSCSLAMRSTSQLSEAQGGSGFLSSSPDRPLSSAQNSEDSLHHFQSNQGENSRDPLLAKVPGDDKPVLIITSASASNSPKSSGRGSQVDVLGNNSNKEDHTEVDDEEDDGKDTEYKPLLGSTGDVPLNSDLRGVTFPFIDCSPVCEDIRQTLESNCPESFRQVNVPTDLVELSSVADLVDDSVLENGLAPEMQHSMVGYAGLSQSDTSLSSNNPSYRYGNQVEYVNECDYGEVDGYSPDSEEVEMDVNGLHNGIPEDDEHAHNIYGIDNSQATNDCNPLNSLSYAEEEGKMTPVEELPPPPPELIRDLSVEDSTPQYNINVSGNINHDDIFGVDRDTGRLNNVAENLEQTVPDSSSLQTQLNVANKLCTGTAVEMDNVNTDSSPQNMNFRDDLRDNFTEDMSDNSRTLADQYLYNTRITPTDSPKYNDRTSLL